MQKLTLTAALALTVSAANAQTYTQQHYGGMTFTNGPNGYHATDRRSAG
jgi:hypothetical protein